VVRCRLADLSWIGDASVEVFVKVFGADDRCVTDELSNGLNLKNMVGMANGHVPIVMSQDRKARAADKVSSAVGIDELEAVIFELEHWS